MSSKQTFCCLFKFTNVFPAYFFESLNIVLIKCCYSVDFFSFRYLYNNFTMFTLKTIVDLFFLVYKRHQLYSSSDLNNIFIYSYFGHSVIRFFHRDHYFVSFSLDYWSNYVFFYFLFALFCFAFMIKSYKGFEIEIRCD